jgi:4-amino-4-deoxy-L-arabinose transferase-like glycosyltransferase
MTSSASTMAPQSNIHFSISGWKIAVGVICAFVVKAVITFVFLPYLTNRLGGNYHSDLFSDDYDLIAENLVNGHGYRVYADTSETALRSPGFVLILAAIFSVFGKGILAVQVIQYFMSASIAIIIYLITQRLFSCKTASLLAGGIFLFHPVSIMSDTRGNADTTLTLCLTITIWLLLRAIDSERPRDFILTGLALGYTMLVKASVALIFPSVFLFLALMMPITRPQLRRLVGNFAIIAAVAASIMTPWIIRNYEISGRFVPTMTVAGLAVFQGEEAERNIANGKDSWLLLIDAAEEQIRIGHEMGLRMRDDFFPQFYTARDEVAFYSELARRGWAEYRKDPMLLARAVIHNSWAFWFQGRTTKATLVNIAILAPFILASVYGSMLAIRKDRKAWILVISIVAYIVPHLFIIAVARYCGAIVPLMCVLTAYIAVRANRPAGSEWHAGASGMPEVKR